MPLKPGGGNHMQLYDSRNGEYTESEKQNMRRYDNYAIASYKWNSEISEVKFHFPIENVHEEDYCRDFVQCVRNDIKTPIYNSSKMKYLMSYQQNHDKSKFITSLGYSPNRPQELFYDICVGTKRDTIEFASFSYGALLVEAKTIINGKLVKTIWRLEKNLDISLITLIPGGDKLWKK